MKIKKFLEENEHLYKNWLVDNDFSGLHIKILKYLQDIDNGFFVEAGAHDGIFQSTTKLLEDFGWKGILIEPSHNLYELCRQNRTSICENFALVSSEYDDEHINGDLMGNLIKEKKGITLMGAGDEVCKTTTLTNLCEKYSVNYIDFFSLDVEGYELEVIKGINFDKIDINYFLIEWNEKSYTLDELCSVMNLHGFELICNLSNFTKENCPTWPGTHQDYLFKNKNIK